LVKGVPKGWLQFRFVQGSPEKEQLFRNEMSAHGKDTAPTLFAWHGSYIGNWHGIVREGLKFDRVVNGRAYGNGVYLSSEFATSLGYTVGPRVNQTAQTWPASLLKVTSALSICEVVNKTDAFVKRTPHFVVDRIEWIQCRFLFAKVSPTDEARQLPSPALTRSTSKEYICQDPLRKALGCSGHEIQIPVSAVPWYHDNAQTTPSGRQRSGLAKRPCPRTNQQDHSVFAKFEGLDLDGFLNGGGDKNVVKRPRLETDFTPGVLDWNELPKLPEPSWATKAATRRLAQERIEMMKVQDEADVGELGWYVDFEQLDRSATLFRWVFELHSFDETLPLARDMKAKKCPSIVLEVFPGADYPLTPPFIRVVRPLFLDFAHGGGGHVTAGGAICSEMLTNSGWSPALDLEKAVLQVRLGLCDTERPARLRSLSPDDKACYSISEAVQAYKRAASAHGWKVSPELATMATAWAIA
jgi:ubiquitin-conjugating enzyme E2 Q